ncbi:dTDP-glucose 4,6-dehydratase [Intestinibacter bartlettii]|uniref:dTDP-glucose 4,6-dehydratase n=1 Tax=Intestinibacter bartlettii TaxID=261299 RepID=UPI000820F74A|nr:dTDP-glucose 4,6-dehydratase [Intestinibacter bartlettii]MCC2706349.1 dTDP-glucose 4,6-dehydratase [Intestinibacter bartlettii]MCC2761799.1 dTDP-glucose 4,6-dehydratase [Intestinibacter bartlettii]SCJ00601.1 dTDP-glucose 4%2C6-dehydratase 2 [uncultured Clostridium sp.]
MKIVVTGGAGFIGSNFIYYMLDKYKDYKIICIDKLTYAGNLSTLSEAMKNQNFKFIKADICDIEKIDTVFKEEEPNIVVNFAAESHVDRSISNPEVFLETNIMGTSVLLECCKKYNVKRYHQISTDEVYGDLPLDRPDLSFTEKSPLRPSSPYSVSKTSADLLVLSYFRTYKLPVTISRCSNNYGPYHFPEKLIPLIIIKALKNEKLPIYGDGKNVRDWIYVKDHCTAIDLILHKGKIGEVYNVGGNSEKSNLEVVKTILNILGKSEKLIEFVPDRLGHDRRYAINDYKIESELGFKRDVTFEQGIEKTINWFLHNEKWWKECLCKEQIK